MEEQRYQDQKLDNQNPGLSTSTNVDSGPYTTEYNPDSDSDSESISDPEKPDSSYFVGELDPEYSKCKYMQLIMKYRWQLLEAPQTPVEEELILLKQTIVHYLHQICRPLRQNASALSTLGGRSDEVQYAPSPSEFDFRMQAIMQAHLSGNGPSTSTSQAARSDNTEGLSTIFSREFEKIQRLFVDLFTGPLAEASIDPFTVNPLIVAKILTYLPVVDLINCRRLNRAWNDLAVTNLKNRHLPIRLYSASARRITKTLLSAPVVPFSNFEVQLGTCFGSHLSLNDCQDFFSTFGPNHVKNLKLYEKSVNMDKLEILLEDYYDMLRIILCNMKSLESLTWWRIPTSILVRRFVLGENTDMLEEYKALKVKTLTLHSNYDIKLAAHRLEMDGTANENKSIYAGLFEWMPNLRILNLVQDPEKAVVSPIGETFSWLVQATPLACAINSSQIQEINTDFYFAYYFLRALKKPLEILRYHVDIQHFIYVMLNQTFLDLQENSLKVLKITSATSIDERLYIPQLNNLRSLELEHAVWNKPSRHCTCAFSPIMPEALPKLEKLAAQLICILQLFPKQYTVHTGVKEFTVKKDFAVERMGHTRYPVELTTISLLFPHLKKLKVEKICLTTEALRTIFVHFQKLEELDLFISSRFLESDANHVLSGYVSEGEARPVNGASLRDLKCLTKLRIEYRIEPEWSPSSTKIISRRRNPINEFTARMTLFRMQRLQLTLVGNVCIPPAETLQLQKLHENFLVIK